MKTAPGSSTCPSAGRYWLSVFLFAIETIGVVIFYWIGLPLLRKVVDDPTAYKVHTETRLWAILAIVLVQAGYWTRHGTAPSITTFSNVLIGHIVLFLSRLVFTLATAAFALVFLLKRLTPQMTVFSYFLSLTAMFSLFLYMQELQDVGNGLMRNKR